MYSHTAVQEACVVGAADARRGETPVAIVVLRPEDAEQTDPEAMRAWCREQMAAYKVPARIEFVDALPRSSTGKIQWREVQARIAADSA